MYYYEVDKPCRTDWRMHVKLFTTVFRFAVFLLLLSLGVSASADVIDPYTAAQGPFTVGPGEMISDEDAIVYTSSVLGGFRIAVPAVDEESEAGSQVTLEIGGGVFRCTANFPSADNISNSAGCGGGYDRSDGPVFDLTGSTEFRFDVQSVNGEVAIAVTLVDTNEEFSLGIVENVTPGTVTIPFSELFSLTSPDGVDLASIDNIMMIAVILESQTGSIAISEFSTDGAIVGGPIVPPDEEVVARELPGTYYNVARDGEGCQLTLERDEATFILTCYFYDNGEQFWVIGVGTLSGNQISFADLTITSGADYGNNFKASDVVREPFGSAIMSWGNCNNAELELMPVLPRFEQITLILTRILPTTCGGGGVTGDAVPWMGAYYDLNRDGEGFHFGVEEGGAFVMTWYTYLDGKQVWVIGAGTRNGMRVVFDNMVITSGADFGSAFDPVDVVKETFGSIIVDITDCNHFTATVNSELPEFHNIILDVTKVVPGACP